MSRATIQHIDKALAYMNARCRQRTLNSQHIAQVLSEAMRDGYGYTSGGSVANAYMKYGRAYSTKAFAVANGPDYIALKLTRTDANASDVSWAGPYSVRESDCRKWAAMQTLYTLQSWLILSRKECKAFIRSQTPRIPVKDIPDISVTIEDSLASGNCRSVSERVAGWFAPRISVPAKELIRTVQSREPILTPFAVRAAMWANRMAKQV